MAGIDFYIGYAGLAVALVAFCSMLPYLFVKYSIDALIKRYAITEYTLSLIDKQALADIKQAGGCTRHRFIKLIRAATYTD